MATGALALVSVTAMPATALTSAPTARARAVDVHGTVTVHHRGGFGRNSFDLQYRATLLGSVNGNGWAPARMTPLRHSIRSFVYNPDTGRPDLCRRESFLRWAAGEGSPTGQAFVPFTVPRVNLARGTAKVYVRFVPTMPHGVVGTGACGGRTEFTAFKPLTAQEPSSLENPPSLLGNGGATMPGNMTQEALFAPRWITLKRPNGQWRSQGSRTTTDTANASHKVTVTWNLRSKRPSTKAPCHRRSRSSARR